MRPIRTLIAAMLVACLPMAALADVSQSVRALNDARADGNIVAAAAEAEALVDADYSGTPFTPVDVITFKATLVDDLIAANQTDAALSLIDELIAELEALQAQSPDLAGVYADELIDLHLRAADLLRGDEMVEARLDRLTAAEAIAIDAYGETHPETLAITAELNAGDPTASPSVSLLRGIDEQDDASDRFHTVTVFYGTNRSQTRNKSPRKLYSNRRGGYSIGAATVTVPKDRVPGTIPRPGPFSFGGPKDGVHIVLKRVETLDEASKWGVQLNASLDRDPTGARDAFIYVHGHGNTFADAARRTAQLAVDLDMRFGAMMYSWPAGGLSAYQTSQNNVDPSVAHMKTYLKMVLETSTADNLHLIAHSMGNRLLLKAIRELEFEGYFEDDRPFGQIVWASPDVDAEYFASEMDRVGQRTKGMTLYASKHDRALQVSSWLADDYPRAGQAPPGAGVAEALVSVDTTKFGRSAADVIAHSDYASTALNDVRAVMWLNLAPEDRCPLEEVDADNGVSYWSATEEEGACRDSDFQRAITLIRQHGVIEAGGIARTLAQEARLSGNMVESSHWKRAADIATRIAAR